jgi:membrane dipeptidase
MKRLAALVLPAILVVFFLVDLEPGFEATPTGIEASERARRIHQDAIVIDLHVDSLLWPRNLEEPEKGGHVDFARMRAGGLDAAALTIPTRFFGVGGLKAFHDLWPPRTWWSPWERFRYQLAKPREWSGEVRLALTSDAIRKNHAEGRLSYFHGIEGAHALEDDVGRVAGLREEGVVFIGPVHLRDNAFGGSSSGSDLGLSKLGRELIDRMNEASILVDLAHASTKTFDEAIARTTLPPIVSHSGVRAVHDTWRNLSDDQIRAVADKGGVIGVMLAPPALAKVSLEEAMEHLAHLVEVGGENVAALGSDFDGYVDPPIDAAGLPELTELMVRRGWSEWRIRKVLGENVLRLFPIPSAEPVAIRRGQFTPDEEKLLLVMVDGRLLSFDRKTREFLTLSASVEGFDARISPSGRYGTDTLDHDEPELIEVPLPPESSSSTGTSVPR